MKTNFTVKVYTILMVLTFLISVSLFLSCNKIDLDPSIGQQVFNKKENSVKVFTTINGFVTGDKNQPVAGARVLAGNSTVITNEFGYFEITGAGLPAEAAVVTVYKDGFFSGIKTFNPVKGQNSFFRIKLIPKTIVGTFNAASGGIVSLPDGLQIAFQPGAIINDAIGEVYNGTVQVSAFWINPAADDMTEIMPGDLRGVDAYGEIKRLTSFGMAAVELTGSSGEKLQLAPGMQAIMTMPMSPSVLAHAPSTIPLWHFDEVRGLWIEEGSAVKKGKVFIGEVSHFSFWNYDLPGEYVQFECTAVNSNNVPLSNFRIRIYEAGNPNNATGGFTNAQGYASGLVPVNSVLMLEILGDGVCSGTPVYTQTFVTGNSNISLPLITINNATAATVSGSLKDCFNIPVSDGGIFMQKNGQYYFYPADSNGDYSFTTTICNNSAEISLMAYDASASLYSSENNYTITPGSNSNINIQACGNSSSQFINYMINGVPYKLTYPAATFTPLSMIGNYTFNIVNNTTGISAGLGFNAANIASNSMQQLNYFTPSQVSGPLTINAPVTVNITEAGEVDQVVAGNFSGIFTGPAPGNIQYTISCSFRLKCEF